MECSIILNMNEKEYRCCITGSLIDSSRLEALQEMGVHPDEYTIVSVSPIQKRREAPSVGISRYEIVDEEVTEAITEELVG